MRLLLDEHFSPEIARQLRRRGRDVVAARERAELHSLSDRELLGIAIRERRALVTENVVDFVPLHAEALVSSASHFGIVFTSAHTFPRTRRAMGRLVRALDRLLEEHAANDSLRDQTWWLQR